MHTIAYQSGFTVILVILEPAYHYCCECCLSSTISYWWLPVAYGLPPVVTGHPITAQVHRTGSVGRQCAWPDSNLPYSSFSLSLVSGSVFGRFLRCALLPPVATDQCSRTRRLLFLRCSFCYLVVYGRVG
jgi:hypothetical protein